MPIPADASYYILGLLRQPDAPHARSYLGISGLGGNVNFSGGTTSQTLSAITFADANGVSFGLDPVAGVMTASVGPGGGGITNVNISAGTTSQNLSKLVFANSNNVSFGLNGSTITAFATVATTQGSINLSAGTTSNLSSAFTLANSNGLSFGLNAGTITGAFSTLVFSNSNNVTFGTNGSTLTASVTVASSQGSINLSAGTTSNLSSAFTFADSNGVSFGLNNGTLTASVAPAAANSINLSAGTTSNLSSAFTFANANGVSFGLNAGTITASFSQASAAGTTLSYFCQPPQAFQGFSSYAPASTAVFYFDPFVIPLAGSFDFLRLIVAVTNVSTQYATSAAATSYSGSRETSVYLGVYSLGTGASSDSLFSVWTTSGGLSMAISIDETGSQYTRNMTVQYPQSNGYQTLTLSSAISSSSIALNETRNNLNVLAGTAAMDYPAALSLSPGNYWFMFGTATARSSQGDSRISNANIGLTYQFLPQFSRVREFFQTDLVGVAYIQGSTQVVPFTPPNSIATSGIVTNAITDGDPKVYWQGIRHV